MFENYDLEKNSIEFFLGCLVPCDCPGSKKKYCSHPFFRRGIMASILNNPLILTQSLEFTGTKEENIQEVYIQRDRPRKIIGFEQ
jgi:hypothetical protein